jgi:hypothetical protein
VDLTDSASIRRLAGIALVTGLSFAAAIAVLALITGSFDDTDTRVILTSVAFALSSAIASAGAAARLRPSETLQTLGTLTVLASAASFLLFLIGLWAHTDGWGSEGLWRTFGCTAIFGIACAHACALLGSARDGDTDAIRLLVRSAIALAAFDSLTVILFLTGIADDTVAEPWPRIFGATLVLLVLTSILPSILRKMQTASTEPAPSANGHHDASDEFLASAVIRIADRIEALNSDPGNRSPEIRAELSRLKNLAHSFEK